MQDQVNDELTRINTLFHKYPNQHEVLLQRLQAIGDDIFIKLEDLQQPKTLPKKGRGNGQEKNARKRDLIALEHQEHGSQKKAKTGFGRESAEIWYLFISETTLIIDDI